MENKAQDDDLVMNLVALALDLPEQERRAYLERACDGDSELFDQAWDYVHWESRMQGFLLEPLYPPPLHEHPFEPGKLLDGRFRILREVAQGGMGVVYEAVDERLERRIAIKCAKTGYRKRLPPEVRHAREISHPNVCKIFEIHTASTGQGDLDFLSMEFLDGETLTERLRRGAIPETEARVIARQLCEGLAEAHRNRVIHGDLKSANIILTTGADGSTRAVITDFGMARRPETSQGAVQTGPLGGTPDYMAPELWRGEKASVASDIYALGVILCELASGQRPPPPQVSSRGDLPEKQVFRKPPAAPPKWDRTKTWDRTIARCVDPDPARRFQTADEVARAFDPSHTRRWLLAGAAAVVLAAASGVVTYRGATAPPETVQLALLPVTAPSSLAPLANAVVRDTADQLAHVQSSRRTKFVFIPLGTTLRRRVTTPEQARAALGASEVLSATLVQDHDRILVHAAITDARSKATLRSWDAAYAPAQMKYAGVAMAGLVTSTLHLTPFPGAVSGSEAEQRNYLDGMSSLRSDSGVEHALALMEKAAATDPNSALLQAGLAEAQWFKYFLTKNGEWLDRSADSQRQAERLNTDLAPVHRVTGLLRASLGLYENATAEYLRATELEPGNAENFRRLGQVYEQNNQLDEALAAFQKALNLDPAYYRAAQELGAFYYNRADYASALAPLALAASLAPGEPSVRFGLALCYLNLGRYADAENELRSALQLRETTATLHALGLSLMYQAREKEAIPFLNKAVVSEPDRYLSWMYLGTSTSSR